VSLGRDPNYLRSDQYRDSANLGDRVTLHDRFSTNREGWFPWLFARLGLESGERVLEVGGGPGWLWLRGPPAPPPGIDLVMSDLSAGMAREARGNLAGRVERLRVCVLDARQIPFPDASFDVALANHMLYHVPDRPRALAEIARASRARSVNDTCARSTRSRATSAPTRACTWVSTPPSRSRAARRSSSPGSTTCG
jgi:ubiquinone/menaquinone biosynthesis C-methylase UbiE